MNVEIMMNYIMGATAITLIVLLWIGFSIYRMKKIINKQIEYENSNQGY